MTLSAASLEEDMLAKSWGTAGVAKGIPEFMYEPIMDVCGVSATFGHGFTYSGHPVCAAVALRTLELLEERDLYAHAEAMGRIFQQRLNELGEHPLVGDAPGVDIIGALELVADKETKVPFESAQGAGAICAARCLSAVGPGRDPLGFLSCPSPLVIRPRTSINRRTGPMHLLQAEIRMAKRHCLQIETVLRRVVRAVVHGADKRRSLFRTATILHPRSKKRI